MFEKTHKNFITEKGKFCRSSFEPLQLLQKSFFTHGLERS